MNKSLITAALSSNLWNIRNKSKEDVGEIGKIPQFGLISSMRYLFLLSVIVPVVKAVNLTSASFQFS